MAKRKGGVGMGLEYDLNELLIHTSGNLEGILCLEHASNINHLSTYPPLPIMIYKKCKLVIERGCFQVIGVDKLDYSDCNKINDKLFVTNAERTICEMIKHEREDSVIYESIDHYLRLNNKGIDTLRRYAEKYKIRSKLEEYLKTLEEYFMQ